MEKFTADTARELKCNYIYSKYKDDIDAIIAEIKGEALGGRDEIYMVELESEHKFSCAEQDNFNDAKMALEYYFKQLGFKTVIADDADARGFYVRINIKW